MKITLNQVIDPAAAQILIEVSEPGQLQIEPVEGHKKDKKATARFDLVALPRVESLLLGKSALDAVRLTERLCSICPAAHHLAGIFAIEAALEKTGNLTEPCPIVPRVRAVLHYSTMISAHALRFASFDRDYAIVVRKLAKDASLAALSPGHFPTTATITGLSNWPRKDDFTKILDQIAHAIAGTEKLIVKLESEENPKMEDHFSGANVALVNKKGQPDLLGQSWRATGPLGTLEGRAEEWMENFKEQRPGHTSPRPYLAHWGEIKGRYRVGPVAQLSIGKLTTPLASQAQQQWLKDMRQKNAGLDVQRARAIITMHSLEKLQIITDELLELLSENHCDKENISGTQTGLSTLEAWGTGLIDGPRGILAHSYFIEKGVVKNASILTPTVQNEPWLSELLTCALGLPEDGRMAAFEESIRQADPCLPVSNAAAGKMGLAVKEVKG